MSQWTRYLLDCSLAWHATEWDELLVRLGYANPLLQSDFVDSLLRHFGRGEEALFVLADDQSLHFFLKRANKDLAGGCKVGY